jgi:uncharacterized protein (TIGR03083 family)
MLTLTDAFTVARSQLADWAAVARKLEPEDFRRPAAGLPGWDVEHLVRHLSEATWAQAEAFHRARLGVADQPTLPSVTAPAEELGDRIDIARDHLDTAITKFAGDDWSSVPLPFAVIPAVFAANGIVLEYGVHRYDLDRSLGHEVGLDPDATTAVLGLAAALMPTLGQPAGPAPIAYRIEAPATTVLLTWDGDAWGGAEADGACDVCTIRTDDETAALLAMGRVGLEHPEVVVSGDDVAAARFSELFPGL